MLNKKKNVLGLGCLLLAMNIQAEVLIILPESGPLARAGKSIKKGILAAYQASDTRIPLKFVDSEQANLGQIIKKFVSKDTKMIIGPLAKEQVESVMKQKLKLPVLTLNEVEHNNTKNKVLQYSLSKDDDAEALYQAITRDKIDKIYIIRDMAMKNESLVFANALNRRLEIPVILDQPLPKKLGRKEGVVLLGSNQWLNQLKKLPKKNLYAQAIAVEMDQKLPKGITFCDVATAHQMNWNNFTIASKQNDHSLAYQRLQAFGTDAWYIAEQFVMNPKATNFSFQGLTGKIEISSYRVKRTPPCYRKTYSAVKRIS